MRTGQRNSCLLLLFVLLVFGCAKSVPGIEGSTKQHSLDDLSHEELPQSPEMICDIFVLKVEYSQVRESCIPVGENRYHMLVDAFKIIEVEQGIPLSLYLYVDPFSGRGENYPIDLEVGEVYRVQFIPSKKTKRQIVELKSDDVQAIWVDGVELEQIKNST